MQNLRSTSHRSAAPSLPSTENRGVLGRPPSGPYEGPSLSARDTFAEPARGNDTHDALGDGACAALRRSPLFSRSGYYPLEDRTSSRAPPSIRHKDHKNAEELAKSDILEFDEEIRAAFHQPDATRSIAGVLTRLLDQPFFQLDKKALLEESLLLFNKLDDCPINPEDATAKSYAEEFLQSYADLLAKFGERSPSNPTDTIALEGSIVAYLKSNRSNKTQFENMLCAQVRDPKRCSEQKMALETFAQAFPLIVADAMDHMPVLKKLIDLLPNLEHHDVIEHNAQRRGIRVLERALESLPPNDAAEALTHLMRNMGDLSQRLSRRRENILRIEPGFGIHAITPIATLSTAMICIPAGPPAAGVFLAGAALWGGLEYFTEHKQPQGTALMMVKNKLASLRSQWGDVSHPHRQQIIEAFNHLRSSYSELEGNKTTTLRRFFNDPFIDPSRFPLEPNPVKELGRKVRHRLLAPLTSRNRPVTLPVHDLPGYETATGSQKRLVDLLVRLHTEAEKAGVPDAHFPTHFLPNFIEKTNASDLGHAAYSIHSAFASVKEMPEYQCQSSRPRLLSQVVEMTLRLATSDETFVRRFATISEGIDEKCNSQARELFPRLSKAVTREIFKELNNAVIEDKAKKGEDGLDDPVKLLALGRSFFHDQELRAAMHKLLATTRGALAYRVGWGSMQYPHNTMLREEFLEASVRNAVEIALGRKFGLPSPIQGMGIPGVVDKLATPESLQTLQADVENKIGDQGALVDFLMDWTPLVQRLKDSDELKEKVRQNLARAPEITEAGGESWATKTALVEMLYRLIGQEREQATTSRHPMASTSSPLFSDATSSRAIHEKEEVGFRAAEQI